MWVFLRSVAACVMLFLSGLAALAAPYAAVVMDARNGKIIHTENADTRLHPASLTKMMTLYVAFDAVERGEIGLDTLVTISSNAASEEPSKIGYRAGQKVSLRFLIRAAAVKSANDAATAIGEAISGSEAAFARRMTATASRLGMTRTQFKNAHGLTQSGHYSTARDMTLLGRRLFFDFPEYYNLFSRQRTSVGSKNVLNTNRRFLSSYRGADGIKTGYTRAAGFNLVASAHRGDQRVIATVFGGRTTATRNQRVAELLDLGFSNTPRQLRARPPQRVNLADLARPGAAVQVATAQRVTRSPVPQLRPSNRNVVTTVAAIDIAEIEQVIGEVVISREAAQNTARTQELLQAQRSAAIRATAPELRPQNFAQSLAANSATGLDTADAVAQTPISTPPVQLAYAAPAPRGNIPVVVVAPQNATPRQSAPQTQANPATVDVAPQTTPAAPREATRVVSRVTPSGARNWGVYLGDFADVLTANKHLLRIGLREVDTLGNGDRFVDSKNINGTTRFRARIMKLTQDEAMLSCARLHAQAETCMTIAPSN